MTTRKAINELIPGKLYQRGQILSWPRDDKLRMISERNITIVVNLWPKIDSDFSGNVVDWYLYLPARSRDMTTLHVRVAASAVAKVLAKKKKAVALILCEAGKTRSVFFSILVAKKLLSISLKEAYDMVVKKVPKHRMKSFMAKYVEER